MEDTNVFCQLKEASENIVKSFRTIIEMAPNLKLYNTLLESSKNPFLKSILQTPNDIDLSDEKIKFCVLIKELYEAGELDIVKCLINGDDLEVFIENLKAKIVEESNQEINESDESKDVKVTREKEETVTSETDINTDKVDLNIDSTTSNSSGATSSTNIESNDVKIDDSIKVNKEEVRIEVNIGSIYENDEPSGEDISELYTSEIVNPAQDSKGLNINKRNRKFEIINHEEPPKLPPITNTELLVKVFTHQSVIGYLNIPERNKVNLHNERLEFLGDAFLQFLSSMIIYEKFPEFNEGQLSMLRSQIVSNNRLLKLSQIYKFDKQLKKNMNDTSIISGNNKIYADVFEAYLGAIAEQYMMETVDGETNVDDFIHGWFNAKEWIEELCEDQLRSFDPSLVFKMQYCKSSKQDLRLLLGQLNIPEYIRCNIGNRKFLSCVKIANKVYGYGIGTSNKEADARAATDALCNPGIKKICPSDVWKKFEDNLGVDENGGLNVEQIATNVELNDLATLKKEIAIKYKNGTIKLLVSKNNSHSLIIGDTERENVRIEIESRHAIDNTEGEILNGEAITGSNSELLLQSSSNSSSKSDEQQTDVEDMNISNTDYRRVKNHTKPRDKYFSVEYTMGRGGVFGDEYTYVKKGSTKQKGGIRRNGVFEIMEIGDAGMSDRSDARTIVCHEVFVKCENVDMDSKNRINSVFAKRGGTPGYITYKTVNDEYLCELWFSNRQIVSYGLDRNKRMASQKAAMLAWKREEFYGYESGSE